MSKKQVTASYRVGKERIELGVTVLVWEEDGLFYAMSPALDITGYGKTEQEAKDSFEVMLDEFVVYTHRKKTIFQELENLGWMVNRKKKRVVPPDILDLIQENEAVRDVVNRDFKKYDRTLELAL
ncbi:MAG TPA: hypothetical protein PKD45_00970 [Flavobacteriales bacterium]|nr:hypothetical protein [Flavobacteriales bacterium]